VTSVTVLITAGGNATTSRPQPDILEMQDVHVSVAAAAAGYNGRRQIIYEGASIIVITAVSCHQYHHHQYYQYQHHNCYSRLTNSNPIQSNIRLGLMKS